MLARAPSLPQKLSTRHELGRTKLRESRGILSVDVSTEAEAVRGSVVTRRQAFLRRRRRKRLLIGVALVLALFPPMWAVYLVGWLVWRSKARQKSMRGVRKAVKALKKSNTGIALKQLQEAHYLDPSNNDALYWLGLLLSQQGRHEEAAEALSLVAERVPGLPEVEGALVDAYVASEEPQRAVYHAQRLLDVAPYAPESLLKLADAFECDGRLDLAVEALERAPLHKPTLTDDLVEVHYRLGTLFERQGHPDRALHHFKRVYARDISYRDVRARVQALETGGGR